MLTHAHLDHLGTTARLQRHYGTPLWIQPQDAHIPAHPYRYAHEKARWVYPFKYPRAIPILAQMAAAGALNVKGVTNYHALDPGPAPFLPGSPMSSTSRDTPTGTVPCISPNATRSSPGTHWSHGTRTRPRPAQDRGGRSNRGHRRIIALTGAAGGHRRANLPSRPRRPIPRRHCRRCGPRPQPAGSLMRASGSTAAPPLFGPVSIHPRCEAGRNGDTNPGGADGIGSIGQRLSQYFRRATT